jgi:2-polyprenyl-3-methyl-5-hydroxy-6-metoxy-1,4-benzoquinol methylase
MSVTADNTAYQENAAAYDLENEGRTRTTLRKASCIASYIRASNGGDEPAILEVGCGTGLFTRLLAGYLPRASITATDAFAPMLDIAGTRLKTLPNVELAQYDAETSGVFAKPFDFVCGVDIIHHLNHPDRAMQCWREAVKRGGRLVFFESNAWNPVLRLRTFNRPEEARFRFNTPANLMGWMRQAGWSGATTEYVPLYLPNGPHFLWPTIDRIERAAHKLVILRPVSGGMIVSARAP